MAVLAVLPFTPPFSICDFSVFVAARTVHGNAPAEGQSHGPSIADAVFYLSSLGDTNETLKNLSSMPAADAAPIPVASAASSPHLAPGEHPSLSLRSSTVLRI